MKLKYAFVINMKNGKISTLKINSLMHFWKFPTVNKKIILIFKIKKNCNIVLKIGYNITMF